MIDNSKNHLFQDIYLPGKGQNRLSNLVQERTESGSGKMCCFDVAPGIRITYNELNMDSCFRPIRFEKDFLQINHCREGCYECELVNGAVSFLGEGDLGVDYLSKDQQIFSSSRIPLKKYRGITVLLELETAQQTLDMGFQQAHINLESIRSSLCADGRSLIIKSKREIDHIFSELYSVDERIQLPYFWIKVIELLLFLGLLDGNSVQHAQQFSADTSRKTQAVYQYILENPFMKDTIAELARTFDIAESSLKRCFKSIAGVSIGTFEKTKRMEAAAALLISETALNIGEIGSAAGYENQSKFSAAFKSVIGVTPQAYRNKYR